MPSSPNSSQSHSMKTVHFIKYVSSPPQKIRSLTPIHFSSYGNFYLITTLYGVQIQEKSHTRSFGPKLDFFNERCLFNDVSGDLSPNTSCASAYAPAVCSLISFISPMASQVLPPGLIQYPISYKNNTKDLESMPCKVENSFICHESGWTQDQSHDTSTIASVSILGPERNELKSQGDFHADGDSMPLLNGVSPNLEREIKESIKINQLMLHAQQGPPF